MQFTNDFFLRKEIIMDLDLVFASDMEIEFKVASILENPCHKITFFR